MKIILETERLILREYREDDFDGLYKLLSDPITMKHYPKPYDENGTRRWLSWSFDNYKKYGFGLWAAQIKETGEFIGDCGITMQNIDGEILPEIGYHVYRDYQGRGYGKEAARGVRDWFFLNTDYDAVYSYMKYTNEPSYKTAISYGCKQVGEYKDDVNEITKIFAITREEWLNR